MDVGFRATLKKRMTFLSVLFLFAIAIMLSFPGVAKANPIDDAAQFFGGLFGMNTEADVDDDYYNLLWAGDQTLALTVCDADENGSILTLEQYSEDNENQKFRTQYLGNGQYALFAASGQASEQCLDVADGSYEEGATIQTWSSNDSLQQCFLLQANPDGSYTITTQGATAFAIGVEGEEEGSQATLQIRGSSLQGSDVTSMQWMLKEALLPGMEYTEAAIGDKLVYSVTQEVNTLGTNAFVRYESMDIHDTLPAGLEYVSARLLNEAGVDITDSAGQITYDEQTREVKFTFSSSYLQSYMELDGENYTLEITTEISEIPDTQVFSNIGYTTINDVTLTSNEVNTPIEPAELCVQKNADKSEYGSSDQVVYTIEVTQNAEDAAINDVVVTDEIPEGLTPIEESLSVSDSRGYELDPSISGNEISVNIGRMAYGDHVVISISCTINDEAKGASLTNTAQAVGLGYEPTQDTATISVLAPVRYYVDGASEPCYVDESPVPGQVYQINAEADAAGAKQNCTRFDGWYLDEACTIKYDPESNGIIGGDFDLYGRNVITLTYAPTTTSYFYEHSEKSFYLNEGLTERFSSIDQILPSSEEHYWGDSVSFARGNSLWYSDMGKARELVSSDGVYGDSAGTGDLHKEAVLTADTTVYILWSGSMYDGVYRQ